MVEGEIERGTSRKGKKKVEVNKDGILKGDIGR